jgi:hypothetical protein
MPHEFMAEVEVDLKKDGNWRPVSGMVGGGRELRVPRPLRRSCL